MTNGHKNDITPCQMCGGEVKIALRRSSVRSLTDDAVPREPYRRCMNSNCESNDKRWVPSMTDEV